MNVAIQTSHNVTIEYELAGVGPRLLARLVDGIILAVYFFVLVQFISMISFRVMGSTLHTIVFIWLPMMLYFPVSEILMNGQTLGKKALNIRVVRMDGYEPTIGDHLLRGVIGLLEVNGTAGIAAIIATVSNKRGQRIGDLAAGTTVVRLTQRAKLEDTILQTLSADYKPTFTNVTLLTDRDVSLIKELLDTALRERNTNVLEHLAKRVKSVLKVENPMPAMQFLQTVIKDFNYYTQDMI